MFGLHRYVLALMVACAHIQFVLFDRPNWLGVYAVFGFYTLSGYLMTRVLHETYGYEPAGFLRYLANRALRIYPPYWLALGATALLLMAWPGVAGFSQWLIHLPATSAEAARNVVLVGLHADYVPRLVPTAWSLHVELVYYALMGLGISRSRMRTALWVVASALWTIWVLVEGVPFAERYSTVVAASLPFSLGAAVHHFVPLRPRPLLWILPAVFPLHALAAPWLWGDLYTGGFYASCALALASVIALAPVRASGRLADWDRRLGDLSYPIFLVHTQVGLVLFALDWRGHATPLRVFVASIPLLHGIAIAMHLSVVVTVERLRARIRRRASAADATAEVAH